MTLKYGVEIARILQASGDTWEVRVGVFGRAEGIDLADALIGARDRHEAKRKSIAAKEAPDAE